MSPRRRTRLRRVWLAIVLGLATLLVQPAWSQQDQRPSNERPELPEMVTPDERPDLELPPLPTTPDAPPLSSGLAIQVDGFEFSGQTAFDRAELAQAVAPYTGRKITSEELVAAQDVITQLYIDAGYATSGATIPDQRMVGGIVRIEIIEGALSNVQVRGTARFDASYFEKRLSVAGRAPLDIRRLENALQRFQRDGLVEKISARLEPTPTRGESQLFVLIEEARQEDLRFAAANDRSPSVGEAGGGVRGKVANLVGQRDQLELAAWFTEGLQDLEGRYAIPVTPWDTKLTAGARWSHSEVVEYPFDQLDIESDSLTLTLEIDQPIYRDDRQTFSLGLVGQWRHGESTLSNEPFCFQPEVLDCSPTTAALRLRSDWTWRGPNQVLALRSTLSFGLDTLGATKQGNNRPDGEFLTWLGQLQVAQRLPLSSRLLFRFDAQLTEDPLLSFERIAIGGSRTVRGYRENQLVRDNGLVGSLEWRVPVWSRPLGDPYLEVVPFVDAGHAWNERRDPGDNTVASVGLGLLMRPHERVEGEIYWGGRVLGVDRVGGGLLGEGIHVRVVWDAW